MEKERLERWQSLTPEEQEAIRERFNMRLQD
jgi:hypothetical protein